MAAVNKITRSVIILTVVGILAAIAASLYAVYIYAPKLREKIEVGTAEAVKKRFPLGDSGKRSYRTEIDLRQNLCKIKDLHIEGGKGFAVDGPEFASYDLDASEIDLDLELLLGDKATKVTGMEGVDIRGTIDAKTLAGYLSSDASGLRKAEISYDDFTEKTIITADIKELMNERVTMSGEWEIDGDRVRLTGVSYRNPDGAVVSDVVEFITKHTDISIGFKLFDTPLEIASFTFDGTAASVDLTGRK